MLLLPKRRENRSIKKIPLDPTGGGEKGEENGFTLGKGGNGHINLSLTPRGERN